LGKDYDRQRVETSHFFVRRANWLAHTLGLGLGFFAARTLRQAYTSLAYTHSTGNFQPGPANFVTESEQAFGFVRSDGVRNTIVAVEAGPHERVPLQVSRHYSGSEVRF
jgi:hypothetical protein